MTLKEQENVRFSVLIWPAKSNKRVTGTCRIQVIMRTRVPDKIADYMTISRPFVQ